MTAIATNAAREGLSSFFSGGGTGAAGTIWLRAAVGLVSPLLLEGQQVLLDYLEKRRLLRLPPRIGVPGRGLYACRRLHRRIVGKRLLLLLLRRGLWHW